jgi:hypothetical protein
MNARQSVVNDSGTANAVQPGEQAEIELKLLAPQGALERLREMPVIVQHARNRGAFRRLETVIMTRRSSCCSSMVCRCACDAAANTSFRH